MRKERKRKRNNGSNNEMRRWKKNKKGNGIIHYSSAFLYVTHSRHIIREIHVR